MDAAAEPYVVASGAGLYLQQGLGSFMDRDDVGDLVAAELLQVFGI